MKSLLGTPVSQYLVSASITFTAVAFLIAAYTFLPDARVFPVTVAWLLLALCGLDLLALTNTVPGVTIRRWLNPTMKVAEYSVPVSTQIGAVLSIAGLALALVLLGIQIAVPVYLLASLRFKARLSLFASLLITAAVCLAMWLLFVAILKLNLYQGYLLDRS